MPRKKVKKKNYVYVATVLRVVDGDTFTMNVDLGFGILKKEKIRLKSINTPEIKGEERLKGLKVKKYVKKLIEGKKVLIETFKKGKYGRYVCEVYLSCKEKKNPLSEHLLKKGMAKKINYKKINRNS